MYKKNNHKETGRMQHKHKCTKVQHIRPNDMLEVLLGAIGIGNPTSESQNTSPQRSRQVARTVPRSSGEWGETGGRGLHSGRGSEVWSCHLPYISYVGRVRVPCN